MHADPGISALGLPDSHVPGRDPQDEIIRFLQAHDGRRLIPLRM
ncbi:hypothetical protein ACIQVR_38290 [Streptomyces xanthochromogenes]